MVEAFGCTVLTHEVNLGKGHALKTGFQYIQEVGMPDYVVCADSDGNICLMILAELLNLCGTRLPRESYSAAAVSPEAFHCAAASATR